jgi:ectoine hydroxylase-related dioxygenase (phytanoyl-CoA dioxygenase family)
MHKLYEKLTNKEFICDNCIINLYNCDFKKFKAWADSCHNIPSLNSLVGDESILNTLKQLGIKMPLVNVRPCIFFSCESIASHQYYWKTPGHQDWPTTLGSLNGVTVWVPLVDVTKELGALQVAPGSHLNGFYNDIVNFGPGIGMKNDIPDDLYSDIPMNIGDVLIFNYFTVHRSGINSYKDKIRWSIQLRFDDAEEDTFIKRGLPRYSKQIRDDSNIDLNFPNINQLQKTFKI